MSTWRQTLLLLLIVAAPAPSLFAGDPLVGPPRGSLVIVGGGAKDEAILKRFIELSGGPEALIVVIPTASERDDFGDDLNQLKPLRAAGAKAVHLLHTRDRAVANSEEFIEPLTRAGGVWFGGGRQWRIVDAYLGTRTQTAIRDVLDRGGAIGGSSAGATIQGSYLVRGAPEGNQILMSPGHEVGFGYLKEVAIDQHVLARKRSADLVEVVGKRSELLGIGIDENTAIVVQQDQFEVIGASQVVITDPRRPVGDDNKPYYFLNPGDRFDLARREILPRATAAPTP
jgi:cyanophycinase